ncbi:MAG: FAD-dependent oxidoreductase [Vicinamibacterales bacterium]
MNTTRFDTTPYWSDAQMPVRAPLSKDARVDVLIVGAGVTGLTTAYLLAREGRRVMVLERGRCLRADTGHTTAHLTMVTDARLSQLVSSLGRSHAQAVWDAGLAAINTIDEIVRALELDAGFAWVDGYLHAARAEDPEQARAGLLKEAQLAAELGFDAEFVASAPLVQQPGVRFPGQARVHARRYLAGLADAIEELGGSIHEHSPTQDFDADVAAYGTLIAWARALGHDDAVDLLQQNLDEEKAADEKLTSLAESGINQAAADASSMDGDEDKEDDDEEMSAASPSAKTAGTSRSAGAKRRK